MQTASEYRRRAREALEGNIFGNTWLFMVLVVLVTGAILSVSGIIFIGPLLLIGPISIGICSYTLHVVRNTEKKNKIDPLLDGFRGSVGNSILVGLLATIFTALWSLLFVIPGIVKAIAYSQCYFIALEHPEYDANTCITESRKMMNGHKTELFLLSLRLVGWFLLCIVTLGVGFIWFYPYALTAAACFYERIKGKGLRTE